MDREQAKELLPIIQAFAEGKTIQVKGPDNRWYDYDSKDCKLKFDSDLQKYRIKPKYRPFANAEECWQEMKKHQPFGWLKDRYDETYVMITRVNDDEKTGRMAINGYPEWDFLGLIDNYTFADGSAFGIKEE